MKKLILILLSFLFISGCSAPSDKNQLSQKDLFEMKQACGAMQDEIKVKLGKEGWNGSTSSTSYSLKTIFYSPKRNSCLYIQQKDITNYEKNIHGVEYALIDTLINDSVFTVIGCTGPETPCPRTESEAFMDFINQVAEYE